MAYMLLIVEGVNDRRQRPTAQGQDCMARMQAFAAELQAAGQVAAVESLSTRATRIERRQNRTHRIDGPFAEAKEMIGGFFLLTCKTREEALALAERCPAVEWATVEVREVGPCFED
ncbi:MAG TPA: YciI family protein [Solimonas sp.]